MFKIATEVEALLASLENAFIYRRSRFWGGGAHCIGLTVEESQDLNKPEIRALLHLA